MADAGPHDLDSDLALRLSEPMLSQSLRPAAHPEKATLIVSGAPEPGPGATIEMDEDAREKAADHDAATAGVALPPRMSGAQEWVLLPLPARSDGVIGVGGEGVVYSYVQRELGREVAVKTLRSDRWSYEAIENLVREACVTARLEHPNIVPVYYLHLPEHNGDSPYWVMKRVRGKPLTQHLPSSSDPWPIERLLVLFRRVLDAVAFAHAKGIVHRDLKPDNVLVGEFGEVQVTDWGLAVAVSEEGARGAAPLLQHSAADADARPSQELTADDVRGHALSVELANLSEDVKSGRIGAVLNTSAGGRAGTPAYMAPEQLDIVAGNVDERTDVFLLGGILYAILTGTPPHQLTKGQGLDAARQRSQEIRFCSAIEPVEGRRRARSLSEPPGGLSPQALTALSALTVKALHPHHEQRHQTVHELAQRLQEWESRSASQELSGQAAHRLEEVTAQRRPRAGSYAEVIALADASLARWAGNADAQHARNAASTALSAIQRRSRRRFWTAVASIALVFLVGAIGHQRTRTQRILAIAARNDAEARAEALARQKHQSDILLDQAYWETFEKFGDRADPVGQLLAAVKGRDHASGRRIASPHNWDAAVFTAMGNYPRLAGSVQVGIPVTSRAPSARQIVAGQEARSGHKAGRAWDYISAIVGRRQNAWSDVCFSPSAGLLAGANGNGAIVLWDVATGREKVALEGHDAGVYSVSFSPNGSVLASGSEDCTVKLWDVGTGRAVSTLSGHSGPVRCVDFSPDGETLASASEDHTVKLWDVATRTADGGQREVVARERATFRGHSYRVLSVNFSSDGNALASGGRDSTIRLWDVATGREKAVLRGHVTGVTAVRFSPDGATLASASFDASIRLWDVATGRGTATLRGHGSAILCVSFGLDGKTLASGGCDGTVKLWDVTTGREKATLRAHSGAVLVVSFGRDGTTLASGSCDETVRLWDMTVSRTKATLKTGGRRVSFSPDGATLASAPVDSIVLWDVATGREKARFAAYQDRVTSVSCSPDGRTVASGGNDGSIKLWDITDGREEARLGGHGDRVSDLSFSPDGAVLASASWDSAVKLWNVAPGKLTMDAKATLGGHSGYVNCVSFSPDGKTIASRGRDCTMRLWNAATVQETVVLRGGASGVFSVCFSPDGRTLASAWSGTTIGLWDVATVQKRNAFAGHSSWPRSVCFSPDGATLASGGDDCLVKLWEVATGCEKATLHGHSGRVQDLSFSPDGTTLASLSSDLTARLWDVAIEPITMAQASRLTGARLEGFKVGPLPPGASTGRTKAPPELRWSDRNPNRWTPGVRAGNAKALYHLAVIREREHRDAQALSLHERAAAATDPAHEQWAGKSKWRLEHIPWLKAAKGQRSASK